MEQIWWEKMTEGPSFFQHQYVENQVVSTDGDKFDEKNWRNVPFFYTK